MSDSISESAYSDKILVLPRPRNLNFSRPRPTSLRTSRNVQHDDSRDHGAVHSMSAFHESTKPRPDKDQDTRYSMESDESGSTATPDSTSSSFDLTSTHMQTSTARGGAPPFPHGFEAQRSSIRPTSTPASVSRPSTRDNNFTSTNTSDLPSIAELPGSEASSTMLTRNAIVKRISVDQQSERASLSSSSNGGGYEETGSHHTVSEWGDLGPQFAAAERWSSSEHDTSGLSPEEIKKLKKKGVNPALYAEMKAARKGKGKWISPLVGNTYLG